MFVNIVLLNIIYSTKRKPLLALYILTSNSIDTNKELVLKQRFTVGSHILLDFSLEELNIAHLVIIHLESHLLQKHLGFAFTVLALGLFVPGIIMPMFTLNMDMTVTITGAGINSELLNKELSILKTVEELWQQERILVAVLIFVFSVVIPLTKTSLLTFVYFIKKKQRQQRIANFVTMIGKWSMADVFVVAIFLAVLSTNHTESMEQHQLSFFGMQMGFEISTQTLSNVGVGFYYFVGYCLLSLFGSQLMQGAIKKYNPNGLIELATHVNKLRYSPRI